MMVQKGAKKTREGDEDLVECEGVAVAVGEA
jgi:hypothetical protein